MPIAKTTAPSFDLTAFARAKLETGVGSLEKLVADAEVQLGRSLRPQEQGVLADLFAAHAKTHSTVGTQALVGKPAASTAAQTQAYFAAQQQGRSIDALFGAGTAEKQQRIYEAANAKLVGKYPTLDLVLKDPDAFVQSMTARFERQKAVDPAHPYRFDFSDYALPVLKGFEKDLGAEIDKVSGQLAKLPKGDTAAVAEHELGLEHLKTIKADIASHLAEGKVDYERMQELSYFAARAMGHFDEGDLSMKDRAFLVVDRFLQGHQPHSMAEERELYAKRQMVLFEANPGIGSGFKRVQKPFVEAFSDPSKLRLISLPTSEPLGTDAFMRLAQYDIFLMGVTQEPVAADGFVRPGSDFYVHDARHNSAIFSKRLMYEAEHRLTEPQVRQLQKQVDVWRAELKEKVSELSDPQLRSAIHFFNFNFHHDRGVPMVPSSFVEQKGEYVPKLLYGMLKVSGQDHGARFDSPHQRLAQAYDFLQRFWLERLPQEQAILNAKDLASFTGLPPPGV